MEKNKEVAHSKWKRVGHGTGSSICARCKAPALYFPGSRIQCLSEFCPNCGAQMDGDSNE